MNRTLIISIVLFVLPVMASAQNFSLGVKAGANMTWVDFMQSDRKYLFGTEPKVGYTVGGVIVFPLKNRYTFFSEFAYSMKGRKVTFNDGTWTNDATYHFFDLSMGLRRSFDLKIKKFIYTRWFFNIGPNIAYWIDGKGEVSTQALGNPYTVLFNQPPDANFNYNYLNNVNRWIFGLDFGAGIDATINRSQRIHTELRFTWGHTNIGKKDGTSHLQLLGFDDNLLGSFNTLSLTVTYFFDFDMKKSKMGKSTKNKEVKKKR